MPGLCGDALRGDVWQAVQAKRWYFGNQSVTGQEAVPFWKMDLDGDPAGARLWEAARRRCEEKVGHPLRVVRAYANGHTYGQGGQPHVDDARPGTYTLLYYPMPEWRAEWEGETVFLDGRGEIVAAVKPQPDRALLFDSRIPHYGRAPGRSFTGLRVTVACKLEIKP